MYYTLTNSSISFILEGIEQALSLRAKVTIQKKDIESIEWHETFSEWETMMVRMPGSYLPRWVMAGSYWTEEGWDFVFAKKPRGVIRPILHGVVVIKTKRQRYSRLILETTEANAKEMKAWLREKRRR